MAHPLAVLPFRGTAYVMPALVIGSMIPDLPHFASEGSGYTKSHSLTGLFTVDLAAGLLLLAVWQLIVFPAYDAQLPNRMRRWSPPRRMPWRWWLLAVPSVLLGSVTHLLWDLLTHNWSPLATVFPVMHREVGPWPVYLWLQYVSSAVGMLVLALILWRRWRRSAPRSGPEEAQPADQWLLWGVPIVASVVAVIADLVGLYFAGAVQTRTYIEGMITTGVTIFAVVALILALLWLCRVKLVRQHESQRS